MIYNALMGLFSCYRGGVRFRYNDLKIICSSKKTYPMAQKQPFDIYTIVTNQIVSLLERGTVPWRKQWKDAGIPINSITKRPYRGINLLYLLCLPYSNPRFMTLTKGRVIYPIDWYTFQLLYTKIQV